MGESPLKTAVGNLHASLQWWGLGLGVRSRVQLPVMGMSSLVKRQKKDIITGLTRMGRSNNEDTSNKGI